MDDLDHSMRIADYDWTSFFEDSEECGLLQPSLARPDNSSLSDSEDSENSRSVLNASQQEPRQSPDQGKSNAAGCCVEDVQIDQREQDLATKAEEDAAVKPDACLDYAEGNTTKTETEAYSRTAEETDETTTTLQTDVQRESDTSIHGPDLLCCNQTEEKAEEPRAADRAASADASVVAVRAEKERWFVTLSDIPARQRARAAPVKKKRRQKKPCKNNHVGRALGQEKKSLGNSSELKITKDNDESEGGRDRERVTQSDQNSGGYVSAEEHQMGVISGISQMCLTSGEEGNLSERLVAPQISEPTIDRGKDEANVQASASHDTFADKGPSRLDSVESDELGDSVEFLSTRSYDSESYLSASESVEEPQHPPMESQRLQSSSPLTENSFLLSPTEDTQDREVHSCHSAVSCNATPNCEGYESAAAEPTLTFPSVSQSVNKTADDSSTCDNDAHSTALRTALRTPSDTPGLEKHDISLSASGCSSGDPFSLPSVPDVTLTPCSAADSPETYAEAAGNARPVFAISAFWDEMEKLTINDILQLRAGRGTPSRDAHETARPNVDDSPTNESSLVEAGEYNSSDGGLMDASDTADSDYFTQPDESKPDRSSCDFSSSDFEEEFFGTSRNSSPDPQSKNQRRANDSCFFACEEEDSTGSEGKETPVPSEDFAGEAFENRDAGGLISSDHTWPRRITKSKSVRNIRDLNTEDISLRSLLGNDENGLFLSSCPSLEENLVLKSSDSLETLMPAHFLSNTDILDEHTQISFPEVFFTEDKVKTDSRCITVYDPEDISVAPVFDYAVCAFRDETSLPSLSEEKPIPIFSCRHPTVRELTIPNPDYVFLSASREGKGEISPIKVVSCSLIQDSSSAAAGFRGWKSLLSIRKIRFQDKGSIWCSESGAWVFPGEAEKITIETADPPVTVVTEGTVCSTPSQLCRELAIQQRILETIQSTRREGIFSTLKQSDMCLVCIAFASWVLRSSDPEAADTWKAALLANVSALSAIQYLRQYVKRRKPFQDDP